MSEHYTDSDSEDSCDAFQVEYGSGSEMDEIWPRRLDDGSGESESESEGEASS